MGDPTPTTQWCSIERLTADPVATAVNRHYESWPGNFGFTAPLTFNPKTRAELANAILQAEKAGHHVRAYGSRWSFSDAVCATTGSPPRPGAMIVTEQLRKPLDDYLPVILAPGVDASSLCYVQAGMKASDLTDLLSHRGRMIEAGGASGQSIAGMMSTSTHSADSAVPPFVDYIRAIHIVGAGGVEYWLERDDRITDPAKLQDLYPCLAAGNIHYDTRLFKAALVAAGSMGVIYSVIIETVPKYAVHQHRVATTWEDLIAVDPGLNMVMNGSYMRNRFRKPGEPLDTDIFGLPVLMSEPFSPNTFSQIVLNPYPFYPNDATLMPAEIARIGHHLCFVTNRVKIGIPAVDNNPPSSDDLATLAQGMGNAALDALGRHIEDMVRFKNFSDSQANEKDLSKVAAALVDFLSWNYAPGTISAVIHYVLRKILPVGDRWAVNLGEVMSWDQQIRGFCVEASFPVPNAVTYTQKVLDLISSYARRVPQVYVGGYISLRIVGKKTDSLLGMQRWSPTCSVEYLGIAGTRSLSEFVADLQRIAIELGGALHLGLQNDVMTGADLRRVYGDADIGTFRWARSVLSGDGTQTTFDNTFTERLGLTATLPWQDPAITAWAENRLDVVGRAADNTLHHWWFDGHRWGTDNLGGDLVSDPAITAWAENRLDVVGRAADNTLHHWWFDGHRWGTDNLGGDLVSDPAITAWAENRLDVVGRAADNTLHHWWFDGHRWGTDNLGGDLVSDPAITAWAENRLDVVGRAADNTLHHWWFDGHRWGTDNLGGDLVSDPAITAWAENRLDVVGRAADNTLHHWWFDGHPWGTDNLGGDLVSDPAITAWAENRLDVVGRAADNTLHHWWFDGHPWGTDNLGGDLVSDPAITAWAENRLDVVGRAADNTLHHWWFDGHRWGTDNLG